MDPKYNTIFFEYAPYLLQIFAPRNDQYSLVVFNPIINRCRIKLSLPKPHDTFYSFRFDQVHHMKTTTPKTFLHTDHTRNLARSGGQPLILPGSIKMIIWTCYDMSRNDMFTSHFKHIVDLHDPEVVFILDAGCMVMDSYRRLFHEMGFGNVAMIDSSGDFDGAGLMWRDRDLQVVPNEFSGKKLKLTISRV